MAEPFKARFVDLVRNYSTTTGTGNFVLGGAVTGYRSLSSAIQPGESFYYSAIGIEKPGEFEVGRGTLQADGSVSRDPIGGTLTSFSEGSKSIAIVAAAEWYEGIQADFAATFTSAPTRDALALLNDPSKPALLHEAGREGLFVFDPSDRLSEIANDPAQAIYVAPATDSSGASGAWMRRFSGAVELGWFGAVGDGVADDSAAIQAAFDYFYRDGGGELRIGPRTFAVSGTLLLWAKNLTIDARGATIVSADPSSQPMIFIGGDGVTIRGGAWKLTSGDGSARAFDIEGRDCELVGVQLVKEPEAAGYQMYLRSSADGFVLRNSRTRGSNGIFCEASNSAFLFNDFKAMAGGGDDCIAIKALNDSVRNVRIKGNHIEGFAAGVSVGSEIGVLGVDDPAYSRRVGQLVFSGNTLKACSGLAYIKPGAIEAYDYRDGTVEDVIISDNTLTDEAGSAFTRGVALTPARGARIRNVRGRNNLIRARASTAGGRTIAAVDFYFPGSPGGTVDASISDVDLQVAFEDPFEGEPNDPNHPGHPVTNFVNAEQAVPGIGTLSNIRLDIKGNGCSQAGIAIGAGSNAADFDDAVTIENAVLENTCRDIAGFGAFYADCRVKVKSAGISTASGQPYSLGPSGEIVACVDQAFFCSQSNAGNDEVRRPWAAPFRCYLTRVELLSDIAIPKSADDANYTQFEFRNISGTGNVFHQVSSAQTGGQAFPADTYNRLLEARSIGSPGDCFFAKDGQLYLNKNDIGAGNTVRNAYLRIHYAPY